MAQEQGRATRDALASLSFGRGARIVAAGVVPRLPGQTPGFSAGFFRGFIDVPVEIGAAPTQPPVALHPVRLVSWLGYRHAFVRGFSVELTCDCGSSHGNQGTMELHLFFKGVLVAIASKAIITKKKCW